MFVIYVRIIGIMMFTDNMLFRRTRLMAKPLYQAQEFGVEGFVLKRLPNAAGAEYPDRPIQNSDKELATYTTKLSKCCM